MSGEIFLNIDRIVLKGLAHVDRQVLAAALKQSLAEQLVSHPGLTAADLARVRAKVSLPAGAGSEKLGQALGQTLGGIIGTTEKSTGPAPETRPGGRHDS